MLKSKHLFCFGLGFSAQCLGQELTNQGWRISGTCRQENKCNNLRQAGINAYIFNREHPLSEPSEKLLDVSHLLISVPPEADGDLVLGHHLADIIRMSHLRWLGYFSTTGVYGDTKGKMVDETASLNPTNERSRRRVRAEKSWQKLHETHHLPVHIFRLPGIYGPRRSALDKVRDGIEQRIYKPGHLFSRIHVDDISQTLQASFARPNPGAVYNICDDLPASPADVTAFACTLLGKEIPPAVHFDKKCAAMSPMARSFWSDHRLIDNTRIKKELGISLKHPSYKSGLKSILEQEGARDRAGSQP